MIRPATALSLLMTTTAALAQAPASAPLIRNWIEPASGIVIGQPVRLHVEVLFPGDMPRPPLVTIPDVPGAQVMRFQTQAMTVRKTIDGQDYVGQDFEFMIFPRRGGAVDVPPAVVTLRDRAGDPAGLVKSPPLRFTVTVPPGVDASGPVLASPNVSVEQDWSPDPASVNVQVGGALVRTIRRQAVDAPAGDMAAFSVSAPEGVRAYADPPEIDDQVNRGAIVGRRTDRITYVFEKPGVYALPALSQTWWDSGSGQARSQTMDGVTVNVKAATPPVPQGLRELLLARWRAVAAGVSGLVLLAALVFALVLARPSFVAARKKRRAGHEASEAFARKALRDIASSDDAPAIWRALQTWLARLPPGARADQRLQDLIDQLECSLFGGIGPAGKTSWTVASGQALAAYLDAVGNDRQGRHHVVRSRLPPLNPSFPRSVTPADHR